MISRQVTVHRRFLKVLSITGSPPPDSATSTIGGGAERAELRTWGWAAHALAVSVAIAVDPTRRTYHSNQNTYFLHGLAGADLGGLPVDPIVNSADPTPLFSQLVRLIAESGQLWLFSALHLVTLAVLVMSLLSVARHLYPFPRNSSLALAVLIAISATQLSPHFTPWRGVAAQYLLNGYLQPASLGVLLVTAFALFLRKYSVIP